MGASYALGVVSSLEVDTPRDIALGVLRRIAAFSGAALRDLVEDEVVEVSPDGNVTEVDGALASRIAEAIEKRGGDASYRAFEYLEGFDILVPGDFEGDMVDDLPGDNEFNVHPLREFRERLTELLARDDIAPASQSLHRSLRELCDIADELQLPLSIAG